MPFTPAHRSRRLTVALTAVAVTFSSVAPASENTSSPPDRPPDPYQLVWADEFDGSTLDSNRWVHWLPGDRRDAVNTPDAVTVSNGVLTLTTHTGNGAHYTGMISTQDRFEPTFGYLEARIDFQSTPGMWSAFWMQSPTMGRPVGDPRKAGIEIDIVEHRAVDKDGKDIAGQGIANIHWDGYGRAHKSRGSPLFGSNLDKGFHRYALEWTPDEMRFYVDQQLVWTVDEPVSHSREFLILSSEVHAGVWAAAIPEDGYGTRESSRTRMVVDYVRVYQKPPSAEPATSAGTKTTPQDP